MQPYKHQIDAVNFAKDKDEINLFFEMGTGKTRTAIMTHTAWEESLGRSLRTLVISPSVVLHNWKDEYLKFSSKTQDEIFPLTKGTGKTKAEFIVKRLIPLYKNNGVVIVNYEALLSADLYRAITLWRPELIIMDEVHYLKTPSAKRSKLIQELCHWSVKRIGLTGTPILKNVMDIFGIFRAVDNGKTFGTNQYLYQAKYLVDANASWKGRQNYFPKWINNPKTYDELNNLIYSKSLRIKKEECLDLPELVKITRLVEWEKEQKRVYESLKKEFLAFVESSKDNGEAESITASLAMVKALRMLQVASGFVTTDNGEIHEFKNTPRIQQVEELLEELTPNHKVILWCSFKHNYKMLSEVCNKLKIKHVFITGEENTNEKRESELQFRNDPETRVVIANRGAGGVGVNLVEASYSIVYSRNFKLAEELQSESRNHRGGSQIHERVVKIDLAIEDSIDEQVLLALQNKHQITTDLLDMVK